MNLPFTPTSFRKFDILQQLMEYESQKNKKSLWNGVKSVLIWAASEHHQHLGSSIDSDHVKDALSYCTQEGFISKSEKERLSGSVRFILESLPVYEFGTKENANSEGKSKVKINRNGILAGRILVETNFLKKTWRRYNLWIIIWWIALIMAAIILLSQTISVIKTTLLPPANKEEFNIRSLNNRYPHSDNHYQFDKMYPLHQHYENN